ncbi:MAG: hypothetical protein IK099_03675 [Clostridia bacterium]|nr:hypothetical protein [Clostridia bacterium]
MFSALLLILMLVILLLGLYLVHVPDNAQVDPYAGNTYVEENHDDDNGHITPSPSPTAFFWFGGGDGGGGGGETPHPTYVWATTSVSPSPTISPTPDLEGGGAGGGGGGTGGGEGAGEGPGDEPDLGMKSAVYVMLVDAETERAVKEPNVEFELYGATDTLQILNTYYPQRISYRFYETTETGAFYFPEKLVWGKYTLHELTEPEGYDASENIEFFLGENFDWTDPLVVKVPIYPSRNIVRVQMTDAETGQPVAGGSFDVVAVENVITADGTLRYRAGQVVSVIEIGEEGYGESEEIYLGQYQLRQRDVPPYYASLLEDTEIQVEKKSRVLPAVNQFICQRTKVRFTLADELYPTRGIANASFLVYAGYGSLDAMEVTTDTNGQFTLNELEKGLTYRIVQTASTGNYQKANQELAVSIDPSGRIDGEPEAEVTMANRLIRAQIGITDEFSSLQVPGVSLALYAQDDTLIRAWTSSGTPLMFDTLSPGNYYLIKDADRESHYDIHIMDTAEVQKINIYTTYLMHYVIIGVLATLGVALVVLVIVLQVRRIRKKRNSQNRS